MSEIALQPKLVRRRFLITVCATIIQGICTLLVSIILARGLGPEQFGRYAFLVGAFAAVLQLLDMGSSSAFFTLFSGARPTRKTVLIYQGWLFLQGLFFLLFILLLIPSSVRSRIWGQEPLFILVIAFLALFFSVQLWQFIIQLAESQRLTHYAQRIRCTISVINLGLIATLSYLSMLSVPLVLAITLVAYVIAVIIALVSVYSRLQFAQETTSTKLILKDYFSYCLPLLPYAWISALYSFGDRWLLQYYGQAVEQAYYSVSAQFANINLLFATSVVNIFWKEISEAHTQADYERMRYLYKRILRVFYFGAAVGSCFFVPWSAEILKLVLGQEYLDGKLAFSIMLLYPIQQVMGYICSTMLYATKQVKAQSMIGIGFMLCSMLASYFLLASPSAAIPGFGLGSVGLAIKMVIMTAIQISLMAWWISKTNSWRYDWQHQALALLAPICLAYLAYIVFSSGSLIPTTLPYAIYVSALLAAIFYLLGVLALIYLFPWLIDMDRAELKSICLNCRPKNLGC